MSKIYAVIGTNSMTVVADSVRYNPKTNEVLMQSERPSDGDYVADENGRWVEDKASKLAKLDAQYASDKDELARYYLDAVLSENEDLQADIKAELVDLNNEYAEARKEIKEG